MKTCILRVVSFTLVVTSLMAQASECETLQAINLDGFKVPSSQSFKTETQSLARGNEGGGGGNIEVIKPLTAEQLKTHVKNLKQTVSVVFNALRNSQRPLPKATFNKLFGRRDHTVLDALSVANLRISSGSCLDPNTNEERDGSADSASMTICLSSPRLLQKLYSSNAYEQLVKLAVHEAGHLVGLDETEARVLEQYVQLPDVHSHDDINGLVKRAQQTSYAIANLLEGLRSVNFGSRKTLCLALLDLSSFGAPLMQMSEWSQRNTIQSKELLQLIELDLPGTSTIAKYCVEQSSNRAAIVSLLSKLCLQVSTKQDGSCY